jgi:hypothetical protein
MHNFEYSFSNRREIRMGSPHNVCDINIKPNNYIELPNYDWQDIGTISKDKKFVCFVAWDIKDNNPGFRLIIINTKSKIIKESERKNGICESIHINGDFITFTVTETEDLRIIFK